MALALHLLDVPNLGSLGPITEQAVTILGVKMEMAANVERDPQFKADMLLFAHALRLVGELSFAHNAAVLRRLAELLEAQYG